MSYNNLRQNPFADPANPFADPSRSDVRFAQDAEKGAPYAPAPRQTSWMEPSAEPKRQNVLVRVFRKTWFMLILLLVFVALAISIPVGIHFSRKSSPATQLSVSEANTKNLPAIPVRGLIDQDTPKSVYTSKSVEDGSEYTLVFSDEFNTDGRSFYPGDDPYWVAEDLHYWQTGDLEWYDPGQVTTRNGSLEIKLEQRESHGLQYMSGMVNTWNKFCFTGGRVEASVMLPGATNVMGLWPAVWAMGNLGRVGYGASLEGMWPYSYDSCDVGTLANQTLNGVPAAATVNGDKSQGGVLSFLPGQKLSRCTCNGEDHPGPKHPDGTYVGRSAPEIDIFEALVSGSPQTGKMSQSVQTAPYDDQYRWNNSTENLIIANPSQTILNEYVGGVFQQTLSCITENNQASYELTGKQYSVYGFEYKPGFDGAYITWINDNKVAWTLRSEGLAANPRTEIGPRSIPQEPMYLIANLGISPSFGFVDVEHLVFPATMRIDYIRVYQPKDAVNVGCDPKDFPTSDYINRHIEAYTNANLTTWRDDFKQKFPKNKLVDQC